MDSDTRKIIILAVLAIGVLIVVLFYIFSGMGAREDDPGDQVGTFPIGPDRTDTLPENPIPDVVVSTSTEDETETEPAVPVKETDWRDDVITYADSPEVASDGYNPGPPTDSSNGSVDSNFINFSTDYRDYVPEYVTIGDKRISFDDLQDKDRYREVMIEDIFPSVAEEFSRPIKCGTIEVPESEQDLDRFFSKLDKNDAAQCIGESVVTDCSASLLIIEAATQSHVYVGKDANGKCGFGVANNPEYITLCSVEYTVLASGGGTFAAWKDSYRDDPGQAFVELFTGFVESGSSRGALDCQKFKYR